MARYFIGIDGGSSQSVGVLLDEAQHVVARAVGGPANYHVAGPAATEKNLFELIGRLVETAHTTTGDVAHVCFALSGVWREADRRAIGGILDRRGIGTRSTLIADVEALLTAIEDDTPAIVAVAGTGSIVLGRDGHGRVHRVGGHGHLLDDDGSGYDIGRSGLRAVLEASDGRGPATALTETLPAAAGLESVDEIVPWLYGPAERKRDVARLAPRVIEAAAKGDGPAKAILERAAGELARWVRIAADALSLTDSAVTVVLAGGVIEHNELYRRLVQERVTRELAHADVVAPEHEAAYGAARIALRTWEGPGA